MSEEQLIKTPGVFGETGNFLLERELGAGGMGGVYMGRDKMLDRPVAVKVMQREYGADAAFVERFKQEAQAAARLIHPNIAQVYSYGIADGMPYIAMELVAGGSLDRLMSTHPGTLDVARAMKICEQVAQALRCAADQGVVHGDVKPENVLLDANGNAKLVDFGLAAMQNDTSEIWGTPYYIAPERVRKESIDYRADMYSLGGTLYHALTGVAPFEGADATAVVRKRFEGAPRKPSEVRAGLSPQVDALVMKMLALDPAERFPTFEALLAEFKNVLATGLDGGSSVAEAAQSGAASGAGARRPAAGGRRIVLKSRRTVRPAAPSAPADAADAAPEEPAGAARFKAKLAAAAGGEAESGDDEESGSIGSVFKVVGGIVLAVALVAGGLFAYLHMRAAESEKARQSMIAAQYGQAGKALAEMRASVESFSSKVENLASNAVASCERINGELEREMRKFYPAEIVDRLRPPPPPELLQAAQARMAAAVAAAPGADPGQMLAQALAAGMAETLAAEMSGALAGFAAAMQSGMAAAAGAAAAGVQSNLQNAAAATVKVRVEKFRDPVGDEADPMSPKGIEYLKQKEEFFAQLKRQAEAAADGPAADAPPSAEAPAAPETPAVPETPAAPEVAAAPAAPSVDAPVCVKQMHGLWEKAYGAAAAYLRFSVKAEALLAEFGKAEAVNECNEENMRFLADETKRLKSLFDELKGMKEVEIIQKAGGAMEKGAKIVKEAARIIRIKIRERERADAEERARQAAAEKEAREKSEREQLVKDETDAAAAAFAKLFNDGALRQLDWKGARRQLKALRDVCKTPAGQIAVDAELKKIAMLESVQEILRRNLKDYVFRKGELRGYKVVEAGEKEISCVDTKDSAAQTRKITWQTFYAKYRTSLNEICNLFIRRGNENGQPRLNLRAQTEALLGYAMSLQYIFADDPSALDHLKRIVKEAVKRMPSCIETAKGLFPDVDLSEIEAEAASEQL